MNIDEAQTVSSPAVTIREPSDNIRSTIRNESTFESNIYAIDTSWYVLRFTNETEVQILSDNVDKGRKQLLFLSFLNTTTADIITY